MKKKCIVVGAGFSGLSLGCYLLKFGFDVTILEKHSLPGGRSRQLSENGFTFDMGPSWYWMPEIFESFFSDFNKDVSKLYHLKKLSPAYQVFWEDNSKTIISETFDNIIETYEKLEKGAGKKLIDLLEDAKTKYEISMKVFVKKPSLSLFEFLNFQIIKNVFKLHMFKTIRKLTNRNFANPKLKMLFEFPILFLGGLPKNTPSLYSLMNYADYKLGTWYPKGGFFSVIKAMEKVFKELGGNILFNREVSDVEIKNHHITSLKTTKGQQYTSDIVTFSCDYHFADTKLIPKHYRNYSDKFWNKQKMAPSCILFYLGLDCKVPQLEHHNLFFDENFDNHAKVLYDKSNLPEEPLFYVNVPSKTDDSLCFNKNHETVFILIPTPSGIVDISDQKIKKYFDIVSNRIKNKIGFDIRQHILYKKTYSSKDFIQDYNAFQGNAYGLANTLSQTAFFKPKCVHKKLKNTFFTGQLTIPGPGVPPSIISGEVVAKLIKKKFG